MAVPILTRKLVNYLLSDAKHNAGDQDRWERTIQAVFNYTNKQADDDDKELVSMVLSQKQPTVIHTFDEIEKQKILENYEQWTEESRALAQKIWNLCATKHDVQVGYAPNTLDEISDMIEEFRQKEIINNQPKGN